MICFRFRYVRLSSYRTLQILNLSTGDLKELSKWSDELSFHVPSHPMLTVVSHLTALKNYQMNYCERLAHAYLGILGLGSELYPGNMQRMLNKDLTRFMSFSRIPKSSKQKKGSAGRVKSTSQTMRTFECRGPHDAQTKCSGRARRYLACSRLLERSAKERTRGRKRGAFFSPRVPLSPSRFSLGAWNRLDVTSPVNKPNWLLTLRRRACLFRPIFQLVPLVFFVALYWLKYWPK